MMDVISQGKRMAVTADGFRNISCQAVEEDMTMKEQHSEQRRAFLKMISVLGGAALCLGTVRRNEAGKAPAFRQTQPSSAQGYRETNHIRKYYETARG